MAQGMNAKPETPEPHPVDTHVGNRLRVQRKLLGMSQEAIARSIGITFQQVQKYERGVNRMSASRLYDFSRVLHVPISFFFEGLESPSHDQLAGLAEPEAGGFQAEPVLKADAIEALRAFSRVKEPALRKHIVNLIKAIADDQTFVGE